MKIIIRKGMQRNLVGFDVIIETENAEKLDMVETKKALDHASEMRNYLLSLTKEQKKSFT